MYYQSPASAVNLERVDLGLLPPIGGLLPHLGRHEVLGPADGLHGLQDGLVGPGRSASRRGSGPRWKTAGRSQV